jgi:hypothetical protein
MMKKSITQRTHCMHESVLEYQGTRVLEDVRTTHHRSNVLVYSTSSEFASVARSAAVHSFGGEYTDAPW